MSTISGILNRSGQPIEVDEMTAMVSVMQQFPSSRKRILCRGPVGIAEIDTHHQFGIRSSDSKPNRYKHIDVVFIGRLDNCRTLSRLLDIAAKNLPDISDHDVVIHSYLKWGISCVDHFLGDWGFALWDNSKQLFLLARDQCGRVDLFYHYDASRQRLVFSSNVKGILHLSGFSRQLNLHHIAQHGKKMVRNASTPYKGIERLLPGQLLTTEATGINLRQYWRVQDVKQVRLSSDDEYIAQFVSIYTDAVRSALGTQHPVGAFLSGGLDSGSVTLIAAQELARKGKRLHTFSAIPAFDTKGLTSNRIGDETPNIRHLIAHVNNISPSYIKSDRMTPLAAIKLVLKILDEPFVNASNANWIHSIFQAASQQNIRTLLCGDGGNLTVSYTGNRFERLDSLYQKGQWYEMTRDSLVTLWYKGVRLASRLSPLEITQNGRFVGNSLRKHTILSPVRSDFATDIINSDIVNKETNRSDDQLCEQANRISMCLQQSLLTRAWNWSNAWGIEMRDPTMDRRVVEFCVGVPRELYMRSGQNRLLLRRALSGKMPPQILWDTQRGLQSADIVRQVQASRKEIEDAMLQIEASHLVTYCLDTPAMRSVLNHIDNNPNYGTSLETMRILLQGLQIGLFLLRFD